MPAQTNRPVRTSELVMGQPGAALVSNKLAYSPFLRSPSADGPTASGAEPSHSATHLPDYSARAGSASATRGGVGVMVGKSGEVLVLE